MKAQILELLACPNCGSTLRLPDGGGVIHDVESGALICIGCRAAFPVVGSIPRFVTSDSYVKSFSFEWTRFRTTQLDSVTGRGESEQRFRQSFDFPLEGLADRLVLDAGCGMGRFAEVALKHGATIVGVDLSLAVEAAHQNLGSHPRAHFIQADLFRLPFRQAAFDIIYSLGVLHHTPDPQRAFQDLVKLLKPDGKITVTLYSGYNKFYVRATNFWRRLTTMLPARVLYSLAHAAIPLYYVYRLPVIGLILQGLLPISMHSDPAWRVLDTFDCYSPRFQSYHTHYEVFQWFRESKLTEITVLEPGISFIATKGT